MSQGNQVIEINGEKDITKLALLYSSDPLHQARIQNDFQKGYFKGLLSVSLKTGSILGYVLYFKTYSTWQHRTYFVSDIWLSDELGTDENKFNELKAIFDQLIQISRNNQINRINLNMNINTERKTIEWLEGKLIGVVNLSKAEDWFIMEMGYDEILEFKNRSSPIKQGFKVNKVTNIDEYAQATRQLIYELAEFEKLESQCEITESGLIRDYQDESKYYELAVLTKDDVPVGFAIYYLKYDLKRGLGFFLEDLYVKQEFRGNGLGTCLWRFVIEDILASHSATYMQWTVLSWNKGALEFYYKYKAKNLTEPNGIHFFRMLKETIYAC